MQTQHIELRSRAVLVILVVLSSFLTLTGCRADQQSSKPVPKPATQEITYPANFIKHFFSKDEPTAQDYVQGMKDIVPEYYTDVYAHKNGDITIVVTKKQLHKLIKENDDDIKASEKDFLGKGEDYRYQIGKDGRTMDLWLDKHVPPMGEAGMTLDLPQDYATNYYLKGGKGDWDMTITFHNCHTGQTVYQYQWSQGSNYTIDQFGD